MRKPNSAEWGIFYNSAIASPGRRNFTLAHELGHYLLHRMMAGNEIICEKSDMWEWDSAYRVRESEANQFASFLLMPRDDFDIQTAEFVRPVVSDFAKLSGRYNVSITAAVLKWLELTNQRAMVVISRDGFIDWAWSSKPLLRSGVFLRTRKGAMELPDSALAAKITEGGVYEGVVSPMGCWSKREEVFESALLSEYHDKTISLLVYPKTPPPYALDEDI